jgi:recombination protein RecA
MGRGRPRKIKSEETSGDLTLENEISQADSKLSSALPEPKEKPEINPKLKKVVNDLSKQFGHSFIHMASEEEEREKIPTGIESIDKMLGGGIPCGQFSVLWGNRSSAKSTLALLTIAQAQKAGKTCIYIDLEESFDKEWAMKCGVNIESLPIAHYKIAEQALDTIIKLSAEKCVDLIVLDSIQSLSPKEESESKAGKEKSVEDSSMALLARKLSQFFRMSVSVVAKGKVAVLLIGQARTDLGSFIKLDTLSSGHALQHFSAITMKSYRGAKADAPRYKFETNGKKKELIIGFPLNIKIEKTKVNGTAPEGTSVCIPFYFEYGFNKPNEEQIKNTFGEWIEFESEE